MTNEGIVTRLIVKHVLSTASIRNVESVLFKNKQRKIFEDNKNDSSPSLNLQLVFFIKTRIYERQFNLAQCFHKLSITFRTYTLV